MRLDLRPPELSKLVDSEVGSASRHSSSVDNSVSANLNQLSAVKPVGAAEEFARRVHREGLPVARLFESKSALVSLGLNQQGKPGLWLIQKTALSAEIADRRYGLCPTMTSSRKHFQGWRFDWQTPSDFVALYFMHDIRG
jgi:hypothetical protein